MTSIAIPPSSQNAGLIQQVMSTALAKEVASASLGRTKNKREHKQDFVKNGKSETDCVLAQNNLQTKRRKQQQPLPQQQPKKADMKVALTLPSNTPISTSIMNTNCSTSLTTSTKTIAKGGSSEECVKKEDSTNIKGKEENAIVEKPKRIVKKRFVQKISCVPSHAISLNFLKEIADPFLCPPPSFTSCFKGDEGDEKLLKVTCDSLNSLSSTPSPSSEINFNSTLFGDSLLAIEIEGKDRLYPDYITFL